MGKHALIKTVWNCIFAQLQTRSSNFVFYSVSVFFLPRVFLFHSKSELLWKRIFLLNARCFFWNVLVIGYSKYPIKLPKNDPVEMFQSISRIQKSCLLMDDLELINSWQMTMLMFSILNVNDERLITWSKVCSAIIIHSNTSYNSCYQIELLKVFTKLNIFGLVLADCITVTSKHGNFQYKASSNDMTLGATCGLYFITDPDKRIEIEITHLELSCEGGIISVSLSLISYQKKKKKKKKKLVERDPWKSRNNGKRLKGSIIET